VFWNETNIPPKFCAESIETAVHVRNKFPSDAISGDLQHKKWKGNIPDIYYL